MHFAAGVQKTPRKCALCMNVLSEICSSVRTDFFRAVRLFANEPVYPEVAAQITDYLSKIKSDTIDDAIDVVSWAVRSSAIGKTNRMRLLAVENMLEHFRGRFGRVISRWTKRDHFGVCY